EVRVLHNFATSTADNIAQMRDRVDFFERDITKPEQLPDVFRGVDYVLHEAAVPSVPRSVADPLLVHQACATGTLNVLIAARDAKVKRVVYAASSSAYGNVAWEYQSEAQRPSSL